MTVLGAALLLATGALRAQQSPAPTPSSVATTPDSRTPDANAVTSTDNVVQMQEYDVKDELIGEAKALQTQHAAPNLINVISADKMGTFTDLNVAESLQRLPGISIASLATGEGRFISIRGARPSYNGTLLNGFTVPSGDKGERRNDLQVLSNNLVDSVEVAKVSMPDMPSEGIGGIVNVMFRDPNNITNPEGNVSLYYGQVELGVNGKGKEDRESISYGTRFTPTSKFALNVSMNHRYADKMSYETTVGAPSLVTGAGGAQVWLPSQIIPNTYAQSKGGDGGLISLGYKFSDDSSITIHAYGEHYISNFLKNTFLYQAFAPYKDPTQGGATDITTQGGRVTYRISRRYRPEQYGLWLYGLQIKEQTNFGNGYRMELGWSRQRATENYNNDDIGISQNIVPADPLKVTLGGIDQFYLTPTTAASANQIYDPHSFFVNSITITTFRKDGTSENTPYANLFKKWDLAEHSSLQLEVGYYGRWRIQMPLQADFQWTRLATDAPNQATFGDLGTTGYITDYDKRGIALGSIPDKNVYLFYQQNNPTLFNPGKQLNYPGDVLSFTTHEDINSGFFMFTYVNGPFTAVAGLRDEHTAVKFASLSSAAAVGGTTANPVFATQHSSYNDPLPGVDLRYDINRNMLVRASYTETVGRPDPQSVYGNVTEDDALLTINVPNPGLKALVSHNFDASFEWYMGQLGQFMVGAFTKDIDNFGFSSTDFPVINGKTYTRTSVQANAKGNLKGWEVSFQRDLKFLPYPFNGLGFEANYCGISSVLHAAPSFGRIGPDAPLEQQPAYTANVSIYYSIFGAFLRVSEAFAGRQINDGGTSTDSRTDQYLAPHEEVTATLNYDFGKGWRLFAEARNLTDKSLDYYYNTPGQHTIGGKSTYGRAWGGGVRKRF